MNRNRTFKGIPGRPMSDEAFERRFWIRFWSRVEKTETCWLWRSHLTATGYGTISRKDKPHAAHRLSYEHLVGPIPQGLTIDHLCRVRNCVRPDHLEPVSTKVNVLRGVGITAREAQQTHCKHGHELTADNIWESALPWRKCRTCSREKDRRRSLLRRATRLGLLPASPPA